MAARARAAAEQGARVAALGAAARGRRAATGTRRAGAKPGPRPRRDFPLPGGRRRGREGRRRPRCVNPFGAPGPPAPRPRGQPFRTAASASGPFRGGGTRGPTRSGPVGTSEPTRVTLVPEDSVSPEELPWSPRPLWTRVTGTPPTSHLPCAPRSPPSPSGPIRDFSVVGEAEEERACSPPSLLRFPLPSSLFPFAGRPPCTALLGPLGRLPRAGLQGRGTGGAMSLGKEALRGLGRLCQGPQLCKPSLCPQLEALLTTKGRPACLAATSSLFIHQQIFHSKPFLSPAFINLLVCVRDPAIPV